MAFSGWPDTRVLLPLKYLDSIEKTNTLYYIPNAISVVMNDQEKFFFGSFIDRDYCYNLLKNMSEVEKRMIEIHGEDILRDLRSLQFGFLGKKDVEIIPASPTDMKDANLAPSDAQTNPTDTNQSDTNEFERKDSFNLDNDQPDSVFVPDPEDDTIDFSTVYNTSGITVLLDKSLDSSPLELWSCCWLYGNGYW